MAHAHFWRLHSGASIAPFRLDRPAVTDASFQKTFHA